LLTCGLTEGSTLYNRLEVVNYLWLEVVMGTGFSSLIKSVYECLPTPVFQNIANGRSPCENLLGFLLGFGDKWYEKVEI
jgi:large-conductance mechanosensitive channel